MNQKTVTKIATRIFPVIHTSSNLKLNLEQIFTAYDGSADGVFLISHNLSAEKFSELIDKMDYLAVAKYKNDPKKWPPDFHVGVNYLGVNSLPAAELFKPWMSMLWSDKSSIYLENLGGESKVAKEVIEKIKSTGHIGSQFFGGLGFKYQPQPDYEELHRLISIACSIDGYIVTTSGDATGSQPSVEKIKMFREIMPADKRLAIASGVSVSNVSSFIDAGATDILVSSSVNDNDVLNLKKLKELVSEANGKEVSV